LTVPFFIVAIPEATAEGLVVVGALGLILGAVLIQVREARFALRQDTPIGKTVLTATAEFYLGAMAMAGVAFVPLGHALGTFNALSSTKYSGESIFSRLVIWFGASMLASTAVVTLLAAIARKANQRRTKS
jgi:hypothetical protein